MEQYRIARLTDPAKLKQLMKNARELQREDVYDLAFKRLCEVESMNYKDPLERNFHSVLAAYELLLTEKNGRNTKATRTRQKMKRKGIEQCLIDWATGSPTEGFKLLIEKGLSELTAEHLVLEFADKFSPDIVAAARARLVESGVTRLP